MKKTLFTVFLVAILLLGCVLTLSACDDEGKSGGILGRFKATELSAVSVDGITYDGRVLTWKPVSGASEYEIVLNNGTARTLKSTSLPYPEPGKNGFTFTVTAKGDGKNYKDSAAVSVTFYPLGDVENIRLEDDGKLVWNDNSLATAYEVEIDGNETITCVTNSYDLLPDGAHSVKIKAVRNDGDTSTVYYSAFSAEKRYTICKSVDLSSIKFNAGVISWGSVSGAASYELIIGGVNQGTVTGTSYLYDSGNASFDASIRPIGNHTTSFDARNATVQRFVYFDAVTNIRVDDGILTWEAVEDADYYLLKVNGSQKSTRYTECVYKDLPINVSTTVQILPCSSDACYFSSWSAEEAFTVLGAPTLQWTDMTLDGEAQNSLYWNGVNNASGYFLSIQTPDGSERTETLGENDRNFAYDYLSTGTYTIRIKALADDSKSNVCDSKYSDALTVIRLSSPKPQGVNYIVSDPSDVANGFTVSYQPVAGASGYRLYRDSLAVQNTAGNQFKVTNVVDTSVIEEQTFTYALQSIGRNYSPSTKTVILNSLTSENLTFTIRVLATPTNPTMEGFIYSYDSVSGASSYSVNVSGNVRVNSSLQISLEDLNAGSFAVSVNARGNGADVLPSNYTPALNVTRLIPPTDIRISTDEGSEGFLTFSPVTYAQSYKAYFNDSPLDVTGPAAENIKQYITTTGTSLYLTSIANYFNVDKTVYYMTSRGSATTIVKKLPAPTFGDTAFTNSQLVWNPVNFADYSATYRVYDNEDVAYNGAKNGASMSIADLESGYDYTFKVQAIGNGTTYINSDFSDVVSVYKLAKPEVKSDPVNNYYYWNSISSATSYAVYIDGVLSSTPYHNYGSVYTFKPAFDRVKTYTVTVYAIGDGGYTTIDSEPCVIEQTVAQLATPDFAFSYDREVFDRAGNIVINVTQLSANAAGYFYNVGVSSTVVDSNSSDSATYSYCPQSAGTYTISVYAVGGSFDEDGVYYIDSRIAGGNSRYQLVILASPDPSSFVINRDSRLTWGNVTGATRYSVTLVTDGGDTLTTEVTSAALDVNAFLTENSIDPSSVSSFTVTIRAYGNEQDAHTIAGIAATKVLNKK